MSQQTENTNSPSWLHLSFEHRTRYEHLTNPFRQNAVGSEKHLPIRTRMQLEVGEINRPVRILVELQDSRTFIDSEVLYSSRPHINELDILQAHLQFSLDEFPSPNIKSQFVLGRFTMDLGKRRLSARNRMRNTTNAFDGISWALTGNSGWKIHTFLTRPVTIDSYNLDSSSNRYFWGVLYETEFFTKFNTELYYLGLYSKEQSPARPQYTNLGGRIFTKPAAGTADFEAEAVLQFGRNGSLDHKAYFHHGEIGYSLNNSWDPRLSFQYDYASGDADPEDDRSGRFSTLFGARRFDFNPTGIYGPFYRSNINTPGIRLTINPTKKFQVMVAHRAFWLARSKDAWAGSGLQDSTGSSGKSLGQNFETRIRWQTSRYLMLESGYSRFFKGPYLDLLPDGPRTGNSHFFYIAAELKAKLLP